MLYRLVTSLLGARVRACVSDVKVCACERALNLRYVAVLDTPHGTCHMTGPVSFLPLIFNASVT